MLTVEQYADSDVNERRIADYEVKLGKGALLGDINELLKDYKPGGGGDYDIPYFDGGEYGAVAYLDKNGEVQYYYATNNRDLSLVSSTSNGSNICKVLAADNFILKSNVLAYSFGTRGVYTNSNLFSTNFYNLRALYDFDDEHFNYTTLTGNFLYMCYNFNSPINFPDKITSIGTTGSDHCLDGCYNFNHPVALPVALKSLNSTFLSNCLSFNQPITLPPLTTILGSFMSGCQSFNQPLTIPESVTVINNTILQGAYMLQSPITIETSTIPTNTNYSFGMDVATPIAYTQGITLTGSYAQVWKDALPDRTSSPYRKLILAE